MSITTTMTPDLTATLPAISVWQPWASLLAHQVKRFETRDWSPSPTLIGRLVAICASKTTQGMDCYAGAEDGPESPRIEGLRQLRRLGVDLHRLPLGMVVGVAVLAEVVPSQSDRRRAISALEESLGDWSSGRVAWRFDDARPLTEPVPVLGRQGLFTLDVQTTARVHAQLGRAA